MTWRLYALPRGRWWAHAALKPRVSASSLVRLCRGDPTQRAAACGDGASGASRRACPALAAARGLAFTPRGYGSQVATGRTRRCWSGPAAAVTVPNSARWTAGATVEFYLLGTDVSQQWAPFAGWAKISDGQVSADGATVSTSADAGFPFLDAAFGVRLKP